MLIFFIALCLSVFDFRNQIMILHCVLIVDITLFFNIIMLCAPLEVFLWFILKRTWFNCVSCLITCHACSGRCKFIVIVIFCI
jgi:hypothetical protein